MVKASFLLFLSTIVVTAGVSRAENVQLLEFDRELDPVRQAQIAPTAGPTENGDREKRLILLKKIGLKAGLIDLVFGKVDSFIDSKTRFINELDKHNVIKNQKYFGITTPPPRSHYGNELKKSKSTDPPPIDFAVNAPVNFVIPDQLYGSSFTLVTNASKIIGDVIYNTADRAQELAERLNSKLKHKFGFKTKLIKVGDGDDKE
ncbi:hypothetical protein RUM44_005321 [Polyplax serrata]|uniref:Uncharacterized protein n=1 Tax=Polyplax serrata TaxID=468196 RepID=A0ABR1AD74_POLSC